MRQTLAWAQLGMARSAPNGEGRPFREVRVRHWPQQRCMQRRQHRIEPALRLFRARRRSQHRLKARGRVKAVWRGHCRERPPLATRRREFAWLEIDQVRVKNKTRSIGLYALAGDQGYATSKEFLRLSELHEEILQAYRARDFATAKRIATDAIALAPPEVRGLYFYYQNCFAGLAGVELPENWAPMIALDEK